MNYSYRKTALVIILITLIVTSLLIIIAYRTEKTVPETYILRDYNGTVALYKNEKIIEVYNGIVIANLPLEDQKRFRDGIEIENPQNAEEIIEDYDG